MPSHKRYSMSSAKHAKLARTKKKALENEKLNLNEEEYHEIADIFKIPNSQDLVGELFSDEKINAYLKYTINKHARLEDGTIEKDILNETELSEALRLNLIKPETNHESHHSTVANVISYIPKALDSAPKLFVGTLAFAAAFNTANAFRMLNNSILDNSDVVLDRGKRNTNGIQYGDAMLWQNMTLKNQNCAVVVTRVVQNDPLHEGYYDIYLKCYAEPCESQMLHNTTGTTHIGQLYSAQMKMSSTSDNTVKIQFYDMLHDDNTPQSSEYTCDLPLSSAVTTTKPSSTSLIEDNSTPTTNSTTTTERTTTLVEPSNAEFKGATPTSTPQEQTTAGQEEKVMGGPVYGAIAAIPVILATAGAVYFCKKAKDIVSKRCHGLQKAIVTAEDIVSDACEIMLVGTNLSTIVESAIEDAVATMGNGSESDVAV